MQIPLVIKKKKKSMGGRAIGFTFLEKLLNAI